MQQIFFTTSILLFPTKNLILMLRYAVLNFLLFVAVEHLMSFRLLPFLLHNYDDNIKRRKRKLKAYSMAPVLPKIAFLFEKKKFALPSLFSLSSGIDIGITQVYNFK